MSASKAPLSWAGRKEGQTQDDMAYMEAHDMPRLIAPRPVYATTLPPLTQVESFRSSQSELSAEAAGAAAAAEGNGQQLHLPKSNTPERMPNVSPSSSSLRAAADPQAILPIQGKDDDATEAVEKLERMQRAIQSRRKWLRNTGMEGLTTAATAGGKPQKEKDGEAASISSIPQYGEVKLGISSLPGYHILAARKGRHRQGRANTFATDEKDQMPIDYDGEGSTSLLRKISRHTPTMRNRRRETASAPKIDVTDPPKETVLAQTDTASSIPSREEPQRVVAANPDLTSVKEEGRLEEALELPTRASQMTDSPEDSKRMLPKHLRPLLMLQSPSENGMQAQPAAMPPTQTSSRRPASPMDSSLSGLEDKEEKCDDRAQAAAENCQMNVTQSASIYTGFEEAMQDSPSSSSGESEGEGSQSGSEASSIAPTQQEEYTLSLEHGNELNVKEKKKLLKRMRRSNGVRPQAETDGKLSRSAGQHHARKGSLSNRVQVGLHYASSQSRNRRAMEKYSPHPSRPGSAAPFTPVSQHTKTDSGSNLADLLAAARRMSTTAMSPSTTQPFGMAGDISRSSTPSLLMNREGPVASGRSSLSDRDRVLGSAAETGEGEFCLSPIAADGAIDRDEQWAELARSPPKRQGTANSLASSLTGQVSFRKKYFSLRRRKQNTSDVVEESDSDDEARVKEDADKELDQVLGKLVAEQAPEELKEQYEYDVLYENQRGLMFFGIPKFSAKTLFQWDPAPWTNARNGNSAYNIVNAQLPNPSWEWVHPEWLIDMSGDVDESGWQYSYNFGRFSFSFSTRPAQVVPRANAHNNLVMNERMTKEREEGKDASKEKEDHGFEALKRTAQTRSAKWKGIPDQNKYVRRRRWIRLRRRKPTQIAAPTHRETPGKNTPLNAGRSSVEWANVAKAEEEDKRRKLTERIQDITLSSSSSEDEDESLSSLESDEADENATDGATSSSFLPRRTPGVLSSDPEVSQRKAEREKEMYRRHAKDFSGTIRELKSLLPAILEPRGQHRTLSRRQLEHDAWMNEVDARNPFLSWNLVKRRLEDNDMAFATASLRARERRYSQKVSKRGESRRGTVDGHSSEGFTIRDQPFDLTKDAVVEINYRRVMRVMKACRVDRQKILLWKIWLGVESIASMSELGQDDDFATTGSLKSDQRRRQGESLRHARVKWRKATTHLDTMDVWDLLERRLDSLLLTFEYQGSRSTLLLILLSIHASSHANHRFRPSRWTMNIDGQDNAEVNAPSSLSPHFGSRENWKDDGSSADGASVTAPAGDEWRAVKLPRLEFWSDLERCAKALQEASQASPSLRGDDANLSYHPSPPPLLAQSTFSRSSPVPSMSRGNTPQAPTMGSLSNGPSARRYSQNAFAPPHSSLSASMNGGPYGRPSIVATNRDHSFLAELLQLPEHKTIT